MFRSLGAVYFFEMIHRRMQQLHEKISSQIFTLHDCFLRRIAAIPHPNHALIGR